MTRVARAAHSGTVALVAPSFYPMIGGIEVYVRSIGAELVRFGYEVHVYTPDSVLGRKMQLKEEMLDGLHVHRLHVWFDASYRVKIWPGLRDALVKRHPDIIHVYSHDSYALSAASAARKVGQPLMITTYGPFETHSDYGRLRSLLLKAYDSFVTPSLFKSSSFVLVRYPEISEWVISQGISDSSRVKLEPSGIPRRCLRKGDGNRFRDAISHDAELILYIGRVTPQKGVQYAVESMQYVKKRFPRARLVIAGPDYIGYSAALTELAKRLGVTDHVTLAKAITDEERESEALSACDVFVMPSSFEGFSQGVMKAMAQGKPVVVTDVGGLPYEIDYGRCGVTCAFGDARMLAERIIMLLEEPDSASRMGANGQRRAEEFTFDRLALNLSRTYEAAVGR